MIGNDGLRVLMDEGVPPFSICGELNSLSFYDMRMRSVHVIGAELFAFFHRAFGRLFCHFGIRLVRVCSFESLVVPGGGPVLHDKLLK
jgi:hypothetical protein